MNTKNPLVVASQLLMNVSETKTKARAAEGSHRVTIIPPITVERTGVPIILKETYTVEAKENNLTIKLGN